MYDKIHYNKKEKAPTLKDTVNSPLSEPPPWHLLWCPINLALLTLASRKPTELQRVLAEGEQQRKRQFYDWGCVYLKVLQEVPFAFLAESEEVEGMGSRSWWLRRALETTASERGRELQGEPRRGPRAAGGPVKDEEPWFKARPLLVVVDFLCYKWSCRDGHGIYPGQGLLCGSHRKAWGCWGAWLTWWSRVHRH